MVSSTNTLVAEFGPAFETVIVKVIVSPTFGVESSTDFVRDRFADCGATDAVS